MVIQRTSFLHFVIQIIALAGSFTHTGKDGITTVCFGDVVLGLFDKSSAGTPKVGQDEAREAMKTAGSDFD